MPDPRASRFSKAKKDHLELKSLPPGAAYAADFWLSAGGATGRAVRASGDPLKLEIQGANSQWTRIR